MRVCDMNQLESDIDDSEFVVCLCVFVWNNM